MFDLQTIITTGGYFGICAIVFAESGLFFGFFLPGDSLLFTAGFLASQGYLDIALLTSLAVVMAIAGDSVGYWFGRKTGPYIFSRPESFFFSQKRVLQAHEFFQEHGPKSIVLARFIPAVRTFTPIMAGVAGMRFRIFFLYNVVGGFLWAVGLSIAAYFLGSIVPNPDRYILPIVLLIIVLSVIPIVRPLIMPYYHARREARNREPQ